MTQAKPKAKKKEAVLTPSKARDYERLGRSLESVFASGYISRFRLYWISFSRGLFFGFGATLGGTVVVAVILWILSQFTELPIIGDFAESVSNSIEN